MRFRRSSQEQAPESAWRSSIVASFLVALARLDLALVALAGFLARGGIVVLLLPIVILPTPAGLANVFAPLIVPFAFGLVSPSFLLVLTSIAAGAVAWIVVGGLLGAVADVVLIRATANDDDLQALVGRSFPISHGRRVYLRAFVVRALAHLPLLVVLAWGLVRIVTATYAELTTPLEVVTPLVLRVLGDVPDAIVAVVVAWLLGEAAGGIGVRTVVLDDASAMRGLVGGWVALARRPFSALRTLVATDVVVAVVLAVTVVSTSIAWNVVEAAPLESDDPSLATLAVVVLVAIWLVGTALTAVAVSFRSVAWTADWLRSSGRETAREGSSRPSTVGTIGGDDDGRPGDWSSVGRSGTV